MVSVETNWQNRQCSCKKERKRTQRTKRILFKNKTSFLFKNHTHVTVITLTTSKDKSQKQFCLRHGHDFLQGRWARLAKGKQGRTYRQIHMIWTLCPGRPLFPSFLPFPPLFGSLVLSLWDPVFTFSPERSFLITYF